MASLVRGIPQTKAALEKAKLEIEAAAPTATKAGAEVVARATASRAPRRTGRLISSIRVSTASLGSGATATVGIDVPYARFPEFGTTYMAGQHFMGDAADSSISGIVSVMAAIYKTAIT